MTRLPNLELLLYKAKQILKNDKSFEENLLKGKIDHLDFEVICFKQTWGNTSCGFDEPIGGFSGQAMTDEYTTVVIEHRTDTYVIFFGEKPAYKVNDPNEKFFKDLTARSLASVSHAKTLY